MKFCVAFPDWTFEEGIQPIKPEPVFQHGSSNKSTQLSRKKKSCASDENWNGSMNTNWTKWYAYLSNNKWRSINLKCWLFERTRDEDTVFPSICWTVLNNPMKELFTGDVLNSIEGREGSNYSKEGDDHDAQWQLQWGCKALVASQHFYYQAV